MQTSVQLLSLAASAVVVALAWLSLKAVVRRDLTTAHREFVERVEVYKTEYQKCIQGNKSACRRAEIQLDEVQRVTRELRALLNNKVREE